MQITGKNSIAGDFLADGNDTFSSVNPRAKSSGEVSFHNATPDEINRAVEMAVAAYGETRNYSAVKLADFLDTVAEEIDALGDDLLHMADMETALGIPRLTGERGRTTGQLRAFGKLLREGSYVDAIIDTAQPDRQPAPRPDIRRMLFPIGPVAVFSASNFPFAFAVAGGDTASAFAAGCPVVVKGHPGHPATSEMFAQAINRAIQRMDFPAGFFSLVQGDTIQVGQTLVQHPGISAVGFTGSLRAGRAIYDLAAARPEPIPVYAEMGSINPVVILPSAIQSRRDALADGLVNSVTLGTGQFCTNPGLILILDSDESRQFIDIVTERMQARERGVLLNANIERGLAQAVAGTVKHAGVQVLTGGEAVADSDSYCFTNTVMTTTSGAFRADPELQIEHFGPVTLFVLCASITDMHDAIAVLEGNLTATIHAESADLQTAGDLFDRLREKVGRLIWNGFPTGVEVVYSMQHGGPYPATTAPATTSVGMTAIKRFMRPVAYQNIPPELLPDALKDANPLSIMRIIDGVYSNAPIA
jgi:NADP-dependent aldehyde dehydrogenase